MCSRVPPNRRWIDRFNVPWPTFATTITRPIQKGEQKKENRVGGDHIVESKAETLTIDVEMIEQKLERENPSSSDNWLQLFPPSPICRRV